MNKIKTFLWIIMAYCFLQGILSYFFYVRYLNEINEITKESHAYFVKKYQNSLGTFRKIPQIIFETLINEKQIKRQISLANENSKKIKEDINSYLKRILEPIFFEHIEKNGIKELKIYLKNGEEILSLPPENANNPTPAVFNMESLESYYESFEFMPNYRGYHYFYPLFFDDKFIGTVEFSISFSYFLKTVSVASQSSEQMILSKRVIPNNLQTTKEVDVPMLKDWIYDTKTDDTVQKILSSLSTSQMSNFLKTFKSYKAASIPVESKGETYLIETLPLENFDKEVIGYILSAKKNDRIPRLYFQMIQDNMVFAMLLVLAFILFFMYKKQNELYQAIYKHQNSLEVLIENRTDEISQYNNFLQSLFTTIPSPVFLRDLNGVFIKCNDAFANLANKPLSNVVGINVIEILGNDFGNKALEIDKKVIETGDTIFYEDKIQLDDKAKKYLIYESALKEKGEIIGVVGIMQDVTASREHQENLEKALETNKIQQEKLFRDHKLLNRYAIYVKLNKDGLIFEASRAFCNVSGYNARELKTMSFSSLLYDTENINDFILDDKILESTIICKRKDGNKFWLHTTIIPQREKHKNLVGYILYSRDISNEMYIKGIAYLDDLTQAFNRKKFNEVIENNILSVKRYKYNSALVFFDLDDFKALNDEFGHLVGDKILKDLSSIVKKNLREVDTFARWGGDEFAILISNSTLEGIIKTIEKLRYIISEHNFTNDLKTTCSFGITFIKLEDDQNSLIKRADNAMYAAKKKGKNRIEIIA